MVTHTLAPDRGRKMTILLTSFMSCFAKIPIFGVFTAAFFPKHAALVMIIPYLDGIVVGIIAAKVLDGNRLSRYSRSLRDGTA